MVTRGKVLLALVSFAITSAMAQNDVPMPIPTAPTSALPRGIMLQQADCVGQIYIASDRPGEEEEPARNVRVQVVIPENNDVVFETRSDKNGGYTIPRLKPGAYRLHIGALQIPLLVDSAIPSNAQLPKVIVTILPRDLTRR